VATVGNYKITEQDLDNRLRSQLSVLEIQLYDLKRNAVDRMADDYLLQMAAKRAHLSVDAYLKREIDAKVVVPPDAEIRKLYDQQKGSSNVSYDQAKPLLIAAMKDQQRQQLRNDLMNRLRSEQGFKMLLKAPRFEVATGDLPALGPANAPVTIVEFGDFQDPFSKQSTLALKQVQAKYGDKVRLLFANWPSPSHPNAMQAALAARCANEQGQFWAFHDALFADPSKLGPADLKATAAKLKLDTGKFNDCLDKKKYEAAVNKEIAEGQSLGVDGTPAFFVNGRPILGPQPAQKFAEVINEELAAAPAAEAKQARK
jgi:protein-disulfide isomerase